MVRDPARAAGRSWSSRVEIVRGDVEDPFLTGWMPLRESMPPTISSTSWAPAVISFNATGPPPTTSSPQRRSSTIVIYLGGLLPEGEEISDHLSSRAEVGEILRAGLPATEFRAGPVIGSGSASFEMVRYLTERLPAMIAPKWILNQVQPIAVRDILQYLVLALDRGPSGIYNVGTDPLTFKGMMQEFAAVRGLRRVIVPVPVLAPRLAALWVGPRDPDLEPARRAFDRGRDPSGGCRHFPGPAKISPR